MCHPLLRGKEVLQGQNPVMEYRSRVKYSIPIIQTTTFRNESCCAALGHVLRRKLFSGRLQHHVMPFRLSTRRIVLMGK